MAVNMSIGLSLKHQKYETCFELMSDYALTRVIVTYLPEDDSCQSNDNNQFLKVSLLEKSPPGSSSPLISATANALIYQ